MKIGFIGQGWIGKNYADNMEERGYDVVRYAMEEEYKENKELIKDCDIVFIAVPTPTTPDGYSAEIIRKVIPLVGKGKIAVIKSTLSLGVTDEIQKENPDIIVVHSPEFLSEATAKHDADNPERNVIGLPLDNPEYRVHAKLILSVLPDAPFVKVCSAREAELIKYAHNVSGFFNVMLYNMIYDLAEKHGSDWHVLRETFVADPFMATQYADPVHKGGRGAGGACFIKDFAAFREMYKKDVPQDIHGLSVLESMEAKNIEMLIESAKDLELLRGVYGDKVVLKK